MNNKTETIGLLIFFTLACVYIVACLLQTIENLETLGAAMPLLPVLSVSNLVRKDRRYSELDPTRYYGGLHTPIYRVLNACQRFILDNRISRHFEVCTSRGQSKSIWHKSGFLVTLDYGYSAVTLGSNVVFAVDEWTRTIYHVDSNYVLHTTEYSQEYDMTDVIAQAIEFLEVIAERCEVIDREQPEQPTAPTQWVFRHDRSFGEKPDFSKAESYKRVAVSAKFLSETRPDRGYRWHHIYSDASNPAIMRRDADSLPKAYKVEIDGVVAWLPQSIMGYDRLVRWDGTHKHRQTIEVPAWWLAKNITAHDADVPF